MTFNLNRSSDMFEQLTRAFYDLGRTNHVLLTILTILFGIAIFVYFGFAIVHGGHAIENYMNEKKSQILSNVFKCVISGLFTIISFVFLICAIVSQFDESSYTNDIVNGNLIIKTSDDNLITKTSDTFASINVDDIDTSNNHIVLTMPGNSIDLAKVDYSFDKIKIEPTTKSGKAYIRVLEYLRKHKNEIANINVHVGYDKTTAKFTTIDGPESVVCYANNKTQSNTKTNNHVLYY